MVKYGIIYMGGDLFMNNFTFLTEEQFFGPGKLDIFQKRGTKAAITDFAILLGGYVSDSHLDGINSLEARTGWYWTKTDDGDNDARAVLRHGYSHYRNVIRRNVGARPALSFSSISNISTNVVSRRARDGILEVECGYYPRQAVSKDMQRKLESLYLHESIGRASNGYTTDSRKYDEYNEPFLAQCHYEYEYNGKRYVRVKANSCLDEFTLSNNVVYHNGDYVWVEVQPVKWIVDERFNIMITTDIIFAGVQFNIKRDYLTKNFDKTTIKRFMDRYLLHDLFQTKDLISTKAKASEEITRRKNPYNFEFDLVSEEDIIRGSIESDVPVFLHGQSSEGKSARVKQLDPDCEIIYLRNATPESLNGKSVYNSETHEMIDIKPTWLKKLEEKCAKEKDKIHIVFFDEITNSLPSIQGMAFNIVLDREVNGIWNLPENARIVAAGNDLTDSLAANALAEPLFNRFAHVYIKTTVESWLKWAITPKEEYERLDYKQNKVEAKIHPAIFAYISYKSYLGEDVLRSMYTGEKPNADPRKWEMASKVLYATKKPEMLRALVGEEITIDFTEFCRQQVISVDDVIKGNYTERDLDMDTASKFATAVGLSSVDDKNIEIVRNFVMKIGAEPLAMFDNLWIHGDEKRLEKIAELRTVLSGGGIRR